MKATPDYTIAVNGNAQDVGTYTTTVVPNAKGNENYKITTVAGAITITPAKQTAVIQNATKAYDNSTTDPTSYTVTLSTGAQTLPSSDFDVETTSGMAATGQNAGSYTVTLNQTGINAVNSSNKNYVLNKNSITPGQLIVTPAGLTASDVTVQGKTKAYDGTASSDPTQYSVTLSSKLTAPTNGWTTADFDLTGISSQNVGNYAVKLSAQGLADLQAANPNYAVTASDVTAGKFNITPNTTTKVNVTATAPTTYDGTAATYSVNLPAGVKAPTSWTSADFNLPAETNAGTYTVSLTDKGLADLQAANSNYTFTGGNVMAGNFTIAKAAVTVSAPTGLTKVYDGKGYTVSDAAAVVGQPAKGDTVKYHLSSLANAINVGSYALNVIDDGNPNYTVTVVPSTFTVTKNDQAAVTLGNATKVYDNDASTTPTTYSVTLPTGASAPKQWTADDFELSSNSQDVGTYTVELSAQGLQDLNNANANYSFTANNVTAGSFNITPAPITVTAPSVSKTYDGAAYSNKAYQASVTDKPVKATTPAFDLTNISQDVNAGTYTVKATPQNADSNYTITYADGTLTINPAALTAGDIAVQGKTKTYDGTTISAPTYNVALNSNLTAPKAGWTAADFDLSGITSANVGDYAVKLSAQGLTDLQAANPNYKVDANDVKAGTFTITPAKLTAAIQAGTKVYDNDSATDPTSYTVKLSTGDQVLPSSDFDVATTSQNVGSYAVTLNQTGIDAIKSVHKNYALDTNSIKSGQLKITAAPITLTAPTNATKVYDGKAYSTDPTKLVTVAGLPKNGAALNYTVNDISKDVDAGSTYAITITADATANPNYTFTINNGSFKITPQTATANAVQVATAHKTYDGDATTDPKTYGLTANSQYAGLVIPTTLTADDYDNDGVTSQNVGDYTVTLKQSGIDKINAANKDYVLDKNSITGGQLIIDKRAVTIKAGNAEKTYDGKQYGKPVTATANKVTTGANLVYTVNVPTNVNVTTDAPITVTAKADANPNYDIKTVSGILKIDPKTLAADTITLGGSSKVYNGSAANDPTTDTLQGPAGDSNFTVPTDLTAADFDNSGITSQNAGTYQVKLSQAGLTKLQQANPNYVFDMTSIKAGSFTITPKTITITAPTLTKTYDGKAYTETDLKATVNGTVGNDVPAYQLADLSNDVNAGGYDIGITFDGKAAANHNYTITPTAGHLTITPKTISQALTINSESKVYDNNAASVPTFTLTGPDATNYPNFTMPTITAADFDTSAAASQNVGSYDVKLTSAAITALQKDNPNYVISADSVKAGQLTITPKDITIAAPTLTKTYDGQAYTGTDLKANVSGAVAGDDPVYTMDSVANDINAGTYTLAVTANATQNPNYKITAKNGTLTINKANVTITAPTVSKTYDGQAYSGNLTPAITGAITGDDPTYTITSVAKDVNAGTYTLTVTADAATNPNYNVTVKNGQLTIAAAPITGQVTVGNASKTYDNNAANMPTFTVTGPAGYQTTQLDATDFDTTKVTSQDAGVYAVTLNAAGIAKLNQDNPNFTVTAGNVQSGTLTINKADVTITAPTVSKAYDGQAYTGTDLKAAVSGAVTGDDPVYTMTSVAKDVNAGTYDLAITANSTKNANYNIKTAKGQLTITPKAITNAITISNATKAYDNDATNVPTFTLAGPADAASYLSLTVPTDLTTADFDTTAAKSQDVGTYAVDLTASGLKKLQAANANYDISNASVVNGQLTINPAAITIAGPTLTKTYDGQTYTGADLKATVTGVPASATGTKHRFINWPTRAVM
ncbi:beta strand repeat-containing protein [Secundilactobacillus silagei]|uniref:beta strand repeat-containing protein n=1 Tax=Secundilactobacillus silagei TaxID=1293415 RepID=UPI0006CFD3B0|nr:MBG domain-containing protein [Secundilactobacillus silagei]